MAAAVAATSTLGVAAVATPAEAVNTGKIYLGADGDRASLENRIGGSLADHAYSRFERGVPNARLITVSANATWSQVANVSSGSSLYKDIVRWANTLKSRPGDVMVAYHHEPETGGNKRFGNAANYKAAYRRVVTIFRNHGARNVTFTWQMTAWAFRAPSKSRVAAAKWYPGNAYVDNVGADAYNWFTCGEGRGRWVSINTLVDPVLKFARAHNKTVSLPEFGAHSNYRRATWLKNAHQYFVRNRDTIKAVFYFNRPPTNRSNNDCRWSLTRWSEFKAFREMANDPAFRS